MSSWHSLFDAARPAFSQQRSFERARSLGLSALACLGRRTISGLLCCAGQQFQDWSAAYRLFERERIHTDLLWRSLRHQIVEQLPPNAPVVALMDDTLRRKRGSHISGTSWRRDPLGPDFTDNFIWASRFLQVSLALPAQPGSGPSLARAIPVDLAHAPSPRKPTKKAPPEAWQAWRNASSSATISALGARRITALRADLDAHPDGQSRALQVCVDGTFTCRAVFRDLPSRTTLIGRIRKDARLYALPLESQQNHGRGRQRYYGDPLPTPEQFRRDDSIPWQTVQACAAGNTYDFEVKLIQPVRWKAAGGKRNLSLLIVRPVAYRLKQGAELHYRKPAYLICSDPHLSPAQILQTYLWRWEIEVNFRDEKTLLGFGEPQVRTEVAVHTTSCFFVFVYALLLLALERCKMAHLPLPAPAWRRPNPKRPLQRISTSQALSAFRANLWADALGLSNKNGFASLTPLPTKPSLFHFSFASALLSASG